MTMFTKLFHPRRPVQPAGFDEGKRLFELGVAAAHRGDFNEALGFYSKSIDVCPNPVPYLNRARILIKKIRYLEALNDLVEARRVDTDQGKEFLAEIDAEIETTQFFTENYRNGTREKLLKDFIEKSDTRFIARRIFCSAFKVDHDGYRPYDSPLVEYHFFNELDNIKRFEIVSDYSDVEYLLRMYPHEFINKKVEGSVDAQAYVIAEAILHQFLCSYEEKEMRRLRCEVIYDIHERLLDRDYGIMGHGTPNSQGEITREAAEYVENGN